MKKISRKKKAEISHIMDPPRINNTERDKLKYEYVDRNSDIHNFQSHENKLCIPTDLPNIHRGNSSRDTTTTTMISNKIIAPNPTDTTDK